MKHLIILLTCLALLNSISAKAFDVPEMTRECRARFTPACIQLIKIYDENLQSEDENAEEYFKRASAKFFLGDYKGAIADYDKAITLKPDFIAAYTERGYKRNFIKAYTESLQDYDRALELNPEYGPAYSGRAVTKKSMKNIEGALQDLYMAKKIFFRTRDFDRYNEVNEFIEEIKRQERI